MRSLQDIADALQGYDPQAMPVDQVLAFLREMVDPIVETEVLDLISARERILAGKLISPLDVPPHDNSAMDGYAFDGAALKPGQDLRLRVVGTAWAGKAWTGLATPRGEVTLSSAP